MGQDPSTGLARSPAAPDDPHVGFSLLTLLPRRFGGSETYVRGLLDEFVHASTGGRITVLANRHVMAAFEEQRRSKVRFWHVSSYRPGRSIPTRAAAMASAFAWPRRIRREIPADLDLVHYGLTVPIPRLPGRPSVVTLHGLQHLELPHLFSPAERAFRAFAYDRAARNAALVITPAAHVKRCAIERLGIPDHQIEVIPLGINTRRFCPRFDGVNDDLLRELPLPERFVFYPANLWPHKNHRRLVQAVAALRDRELRLVLAGQTYGQLDALMDEARRLGVGHRVHHLGFVPADAVAALYRRAEALVFPSLMEGFGAPPLEAMSCLCPVASSTRGSLTEVCGRAIVAMDPEDVASIAGAIDTVTADQGLRMRLRRAGAEQVSRYSWATAAERHWEAYRRVHQEYGRKRRRATVKSVARPALLTEVP
jgi:glycosyltransferase involved in cell wall biosynthesis